MTSGIRNSSPCQSCGSAIPSAASILFICSIYTRATSVLIVAGASATRFSTLAVSSILPLSSSFRMRVRASTSSSLKQEGTLMVRSSCLLFSDLSSTVIFFCGEDTEALPKPVMDRIMVISCVFCKFKHFFRNDTDLFSHKSALGDKNLK